MFNDKNSYIESKQIFYYFFLFLFFFFLLNFYFNKNNNLGKNSNISTVLNNQKTHISKDFNLFFLKIKKIIYRENFDFKNCDSNFNNYSYYMEFSNVGAKLNKFFLISKYNNVPLVNLNDELSNFFSLNNNEINEHSIYANVSYNEKVLSYSYFTIDNIKIEKKFFFNNEDFFLNTQLILSNNSDYNKKIDVEYSFSFNNYEYYKKNIFSDNKEAVFFYDNFNKRKTIDNNKELNNFSFNSNFKYLGFNEKFFLFLLYNKESNLDFNNINVKILDNNKILCLSKNNIELRKSSSHVIFLNSFLGFKDTEKLSKINSNFDNFVDYGIFEFLSKILLFFLFKINNVLGNLGFSIIVLTIIIKILTYPLTKKSLESMKKMKEISGDIKYLQEKYSEDKSVLSQKQMELYREKGVYPWTGCLPTLIQIPLWISLYQALLNSVDFFRESFLWLDDLTLPDSYFILPLFSFFSSIFQTLSQPQADNNKNILSNYLLYVMPLVILYFTFILPSGLSLFIIFNSFITFIHQVFLKKN